MSDTRTDTARVIVVDLDMPFGSMVGFMVKWAFAAIPALLLVSLVILGVGAFLGAAFGLFGL